MDNSLLAVRDINHIIIVVERMNERMKTDDSAKMQNRQSFHMQDTHQKAVILDCSHNAGRLMRLTDGDILKDNRLRRYESIR